MNLYHLIWFSGLESFSIVVSSCLLAISGSVTGSSGALSIVVLTDLRLDLFSSLSVWFTSIVLSAAKQYDDVH